MIKLNSNQIVFLADINQDIDDMIAIEYLHNIGLLKCVVLDGKSNHKEREDYLSNMGIIILNEIPNDTTIIFSGGALTKVNNFIKDHRLKLLVANGGFAGNNIISSDIQLAKFKGKTKIRTYNFNMDVSSALEVLYSTNINNIILVSKNVCHDTRNTKAILHKDEFINKYGINDTKLLHDLLMVKEGINYLLNKPMICNYTNVDLVCDRKRLDNQSMWGV